MKIGSIGAIFVWLMTFGFPFIVRAQDLGGIPDVLASFKLMKSLNPEIVITGHGPATTTKVFDEYEAFYPCCSSA